MAPRKTSRSHAERHFAARDKLRSAAWQNYASFQEKTAQIQDKIWSLLREYQSLCRETSVRHSEIIAGVVAEQQSLQLAVQNDSSVLLRIPSPNTAIWRSPPDIGMRLVFEPLEGLSWDSPSLATAEAIKSGILLPATPQLQQPPPGPTASAGYKPKQHAGQSSYNASKACVDSVGGSHNELEQAPCCSESPQYDGQHSITDYQRSRSNVHLNPASPTAPNDSQICQAGPSRRQPSRRVPFPNTICRRDVKATKAWIFEYDKAGYPGAMYILRCPSPSCESRVFYYHPMRQKRAVQHLRRCRVRFRDEKDIVLRFAEQIVLRVSDKQPCVDRRWARNSNAKLISADHPEFAEENFTVSDCLQKTST